MSSASSDSMRGSSSEWRTRSYATGKTPRTRPRRRSCGSRVSETSPLFATSACGLRVSHGGLPWTERAEESRPAPKQTKSWTRLLTSHLAPSRWFERQMKQLLDRMIAALPRDLRDVVLLSAAQEMSSADIAEVLGIPEGSVRQRLFRARQVLRAKMVAAMEKKS